MIGNSCTVDVSADKIDWEKVALWDIEKSLKRKFFWKSEFDRSNNSPIFSVLRLARSVCSDDRELLFSMRGEDRFKEICLRWREIDGPSMHYTPERAVFAAHQEFANWFVGRMWKEEDGPEVLEKIAEALYYRAMEADDFGVDKIEMLMNEFWFQQHKPKG